MVRECTGTGRMRIERSIEVKLFPVILLFLMAALPGFTEEYRYAMKIDDVEYRIATQINRDEETGTRKVEKHDPVTGMVHRFVLDERGGTVSWQIVFHDREVLFSRDGMTVISTVKPGGSNDSTPITIDESPWFADIPEGLQPFVIDGSKKMEFWTIDPATHKPYRMVAKRGKNVDLIVQGTTERAIPVTVSPLGVPAIFFSMKFWYRESDGMFLRYEGKAGGPGSADVITELVQKE